MQQIPQIVSSQDTESKKKVSLYKVGEYVDISKGPMIANTSLIGRFELTGIFDVQSKHGIIQRIQGVSIPQDLHVIFNKLMFFYQF